MRVVNEKPPNYDLVSIIFPIQQGTIYCWGDTIYNPSGVEIPEDIIYHESIHARQQHGQPELWWNRYITDKDFRYEQELEAYAHQYKVIKSMTPAKAHKEALTELASNLSSLYNVGITLGQAESRIRNRAKGL